MKPVRRASAPALVAALLLGFAWAGGAPAAPSFPALSGRVVDQADMLPPQTEAELSARLEALERSTGRQLVVATLPNLQGYEIEEYGYQLGRAWGIGRAEQDDGALLIVAPTERKVRVEVGYGLEGVLTDALSSVILQERVLPRFRDGDMAGGVVSGTDALIEQLSLPASEAAARLAQAEAQVAQSSEGEVDWFTLIITLLVIFWVMRMISSRGRCRRGWWIPPVIIGGGSGVSGGRGGGGFGGGGFSGGGGSFGGGGSSGSW